MALALPACAGTPSASAGIPPEVTQYAADWPLPNKDYANSRATMDSSIDSSNVDTLGAAWAFNIPQGQSTFGKASSIPIIMGDTIYFQDLGNNIYALNLQDGSEKWSQIDNIQNLGPNGPAVGWGKVFASSGPYTMAAWDMDTGEKLWENDLSSLETGSVGIDMQPTVYNGMVYIATVPGASLSSFYASGGIGFIYALAEASGVREWDFSTVDTADLWGHKDVNSGGGCWYPPAIDTETGKTYWAVANPGPFPGISHEQVPAIEGDWPNGTSRPGPNLYTNSMLQLDGETGTLDWYTQVRPHDIKDYDLQISPILASANIHGEQQDIVIGAGKMGHVYAFNRETGCLLWDVPVGEHNENSYLGQFPTDGSSVYAIPGPLGGVETPMAYADGMLYVPVINLGADGTGTTFSLRPFGDATGELVAIDVSLGQIVWSKHFNTLNVGGATVVNDLVFTGTFDGMLYAFKRDTGEQVWSYQAPAGVNAWPAVAGDTIVWPIAGPGGPASVMAFRLGATTPKVQIVAPIDGSAVPAGQVAVQVQVLNFNLVDKLGQANVPGEGHLHYFLDVDAPTTPGQPAIPPQGSVWAATADTNYTFENVSAGEHTISVELVNNDHTPLSPPVVQKISITTDTNPRIRIITPANGAVLKSGDVTITVEVTNFNLVDKLGQPAVAGEGHIHYYLNVDAPTTPGQPAVTAPGTYAATTATSYTWKNVTPTDPITFSVQLVNNDHTPLSPPVVAKIQGIVAYYVGGLGGQ